MVPTAANRFRPLSQGPKETVVALSLLPAVCLSHGDQVFRGHRKRRFGVAVLPSTVMAKNPKINTEVIMLNRVEIKIDAKAIGDAFANTDAEAQADMINQMGKLLKMLCGSNFDMQACFIAENLDKHGEDLIKSLRSFIRFNEEERA